MKSLTQQIIAKNKKFSKINIEISNICNLQCSFCPEVIRTKKLMDLDLFENIINQVAPLTDLVCFHLMGDPLVHPQLAQLIAICEKHQVKIFFVTNGVLLNKSNHQLLLSPAFYQVNFSLHSFFDNFKTKDPTNYLNKIFSWTKDSFEKHPSLYINYRLWNLQKADKKNANDKELLSYIENYFQFKLSDALDVRKKKSFHITKNLFLHFDTEFTWPSLDLPILGSNGTCYGLKNHFGILVDGTVVPCCLDKEAAIPLGNIKDNSINEILNSARAQNILSGFKQNKLVEELCQRCQYIERFQSQKSLLSSI